MIPGATPLHELPLSALRESESFGTESVEHLFLEDADAEAVLLVEVAPSGGALLRLSDRGYITEGTDTPAHTPYPDRVLEAYNVDTRIPPPGAGESLGELAFGVVELESGDGQLNDYLDDAWEGRELTVKAGGRYHVGRVSEGVLPFELFPVVQRATVSEVGWSSGRIILSLRERLQSLSLPLQTERYAGTGSLEGDEAIKGQLKPLAFGRVFNVEPVLVNAALQIYQWHDGSANAVLAVRDKGYTLLSAGDVANILTASAPAPGYYITQNSGGYVRLGALPADGRITLDGEGDDDGGYVESAPEVCMRIAERTGATLADFEAGSFTGFPETGTVGAFFHGNEGLSALSAIASVLYGVFGWLSQTRTGLLRVGRFVDPTTASPELTLTDDVIGEIEAEPEAPPVWRVEVEYARNWTPQDPDALVGSLTVAERDLYSHESRLAADEDTAVLTANPDARILRLISPLQNEAEAEALATFILSVMRRRVRRLRVPVERQMFRRQPAAIVRIVSEQENLAAGANFILLSVGETASTRQNLWELWG